MSIAYDGGLTISLPVKDMDASIAWYQDVLGFQLLYKMDEMGWCELKSSVANVNVGLSQVQEPNPGGATPTWGVTDIEVAKASLENFKVRIDGDIITIDGMVKLLTFYDPDDNSLMFFQDLRK